MKLVGLSGGIASGKSTVARLLTKGLGDPPTHDVHPYQDSVHGTSDIKNTVGIIDCDAIAREVVEPGRWGYKRVLAAFADLDHHESSTTSRRHPLTQKDSTLNRDALAALIFADTSARKRLQKAVHLPVVAELVRKIFAYWWSGSHDIVLVDMPLLFETKFYLLTRPYNVLVTCSQKTQIQRMLDRDGLDKAAAMQRIQSQMSTDQKSALADYIIDNDGISLDELYQRTRLILSRIRSDRSFQGLRLMLVGLILVIAMVGLLVTILWLLFVAIGSLVQIV